MAAKQEKDVGRFTVEVELANNDDLVASRQGHLAADKVRRVTVQGLVDSGASRLVLPTAIAKQLGLVTTGKVTVHYADRREATRDRVEGVYLALQGRDGIFKAALEPKRDIALIGAIVLEDLDFLVDCTAGKIYPRDPRFLTAELE